VLSVFDTCCAHYKMNNLNNLLISISVQTRTNYGNMHVYSDEKLHVVFTNISE